MKIKRLHVDAKALFAEVEEFERRYQVATDSLERAFTRGGRLVEVPDFHRWSMLRPIYEKVLARRAAAYA